MQRVATAGIVLGGGRSSRMGLQKAWVEWGDSTLLQRTVDVMTAATDRVVVVRSGGQELPPVPGSAWVVNDEHPRRGPLQGMLSGMRALGDRAAVAFVCAVDMPFLDERFAVAVLGALTPDADAAVARLDGRAQPLAAAYRLSIAGEIETLLAHGRRRVDELLGPSRSGGSTPMGSPAEPSHCATSTLPPISQRLARRCCRRAAAPTARTSTRIGSSSIKPREEPR